MFMIKPRISFRRLRGGSSSEFRNLSPRDSEGDSENSNEEINRAGRHHVSIEICEDGSSTTLINNKRKKRKPSRNSDKALSDSIGGKVKLTPPRSSECCIYRVPKALRETKERAYVPEIVSIGPFHRGNRNLQAMDEYKRLYLHDLLSHLPTQAKMLESWIKTLRGLEVKARKCYSEPVDNLSSDEFVEMMLVDGCFVLELLRKYSEIQLKGGPPEPVHSGVLGAAQDQAADDKAQPQDPIFKSAWMLPRILCDMLLLENQLPLFVLECLFKLTIAPQLQQALSLNELVFNFFANIMPTGGESPADRPRLIKGQHILSLLRKAILPSSKLKFPGDIKAPELTHCVTELIEAGIKFKKKEKPDSFLDISFSTDGVLEIPSINVQEYTDCLFRNLIAFEQCHPSCTSRITSYAFLMDSLVDTPEDVQYLNRRSIITHVMGTHKEVSLLFNKLCDGVYLNHFYYVDLCDQVNAHFRSRWHVWRATLMRDYFKNPWAVLSFVAAIFLLILTFTGSLFSILSFSIHNS